MLKLPDKIAVIKLRNRKYRGGFTLLRYGQVEKVFRLCREKKLTKLQARIFAIDTKVAFRKDGTTRRINAHTIAKRLKVRTSRVLSAHAELVREWRALPEIEDTRNSFKLYVPRRALAYVARHGNQAMLLVVLRMTSLCRASQGYTCHLNQRLLANTTGLRLPTINEAVRQLKANGIITRLSCEFALLKRNGARFTFTDNLLRQPS